MDYKLCESNNPIVPRLECHLSMSLGDFGIWSIEWTPADKSLDQQPLKWTLLPYAEQSCVAFSTSFGDGCRDGWFVGYYVGCLVEGMS